MEFNEVLNRRYSCRAFAAGGVEQEKVDRILEAGRIAPTAVNKQPVHIWAVSRPETLEAIKGVTRSNYGAPLLLVVGCRPADAWVRRYDGKNGAEVDAAIVYSLVDSCKALDVDPREWMEDVLLRITGNENNREALRELLPDRWAKQTN